MQEKKSNVPPEAEGSAICEICGPESPAEQVWQCTACLQYFCVQHLEGTLHQCYSTTKPAHE